MRSLKLVLLASAFALAAAGAAEADSLQPAPNKVQKYQQPSYESYGTLHGRSYQQNTLPAPGTSNRYFSDSTNFGLSTQGPAFLQGIGGWQTLPCGTSVWGCF